MKRKLNLVFLAWLLVVPTAGSTAVYLVHRGAVRRNLGAVIDQARRFEAGGEIDKAIERLTLYLNHRPQDAEAWARLARLRDQHGSTRRGLEGVYETFARAVQINPEDHALKRRLIDLALELGRLSDARIHLADLYNAAGGDRAGGTQAAELEDRLGQCDEGESKPREAERWCRLAIGHDPSRIAAYSRLANLLRRSGTNPNEATKVISAMVAANLRSGQAYLSRWLFDGPDAQARDIDRAVELAPNDADVLMAAAQAAVSRDDRVKARKFLKRGLKLYPTNVNFYILSSALETGDDHLEEAEAVLRQGVEAVPVDLQLPFLLADMLIGRNKLEALDEADEWIARLRARGLSDGFTAFLEARALFARRNWSEAIPKLNMACALLARERPEAALDVARVSIKATRALPRVRRQWHDAERLVNDAAKRLPGAAADLALLRADLYAAQERYGAARQLLDSALKESPRDLRLWVARAGVLEDHEEWLEARKTLDQAEKELGASVELTLARIAGHSRQGGRRGKARAGDPGT